jgi:tetratricopeptide (TPR) repeat protein
MYVELATPQSDDQGYYVPVRRDTHYSLMGYASGRSPVTQVMVNYVEAETYPADYRPYGSPSGYRTVGFRAPLVLSPDTIMTITLIDADGYRETRLFHPDRVRAPARVHELWGRSRNDPYANVRMANVYVVQGNYREAYPYYHRSIGLTVGFMWGSFFLGVALYDNSRYDDAIWQFRRCSRIYPDFYLAHYQVGQCYERRRNYAMAITEYGLVISIRPDFVEAHWSLGESYVQRHDWGRAAIEYRQAIRYNPRFAPAHRGLGEVYAHQGQWDNAKNSLRLATNLSPRDARARADLNASMARRQRSPKEYQMAMAPLKAPDGYEQSAARNTRTWQGRAAGGEQQGPGGRQHAQPVEPSGGQQQGPGGRQHAQPVKPSGGEQQGPGGRQHAQPVKPSGGGHTQSVKPSGGQQQQGSGGQQHGQAAKTSGGGHGQSAKPSGGGHGQSAKPSGGQQQGQHGQGGGSKDR